MAARTLLLKLHRPGLIHLPPPRRSNSNCPMNLPDFLKKHLLAWEEVFAKQRSLDKALTVAFGILCGVGKCTITRAIGFHNSSSAGPIKNSAHSLRPCAENSRLKSVVKRTMLTASSAGSIGCPLPRSPSRYSYLQPPPPAAL